MVPLFAFFLLNCAKQHQINLAFCLLSSKFRLHSIHRKFLQTENVYKQNYHCANNWTKWKSRTFSQFSKTIDISIAISFHDQIFLYHLRTFPIFPSHIFPLRFFAANVSLAKLSMAIYALGQFFYGQIFHAHLRI